MAFDVLTIGSSFCSLNTLIWEAAMPIIDSVDGGSPSTDNSGSNACHKRVYLEIGYVSQLLLTTWSQQLWPVELDRN